MIYLIFHIFLTVSKSLEDISMKDSTEIFGTVTVGQRGQVVIPMKARKALKIKEGDQLIVMSGLPGKKDVVRFIPMERISGFLEQSENRIEALKKELSKQKKK